MRRWPTPSISRKGRTVRRLVVQRVRRSALHEAVDIAAPLVFLALDAESEAVMHVDSECRRYCAATPRQRGTKLVNRRAGLAAKEGHKKLTLAARTRRARLGLRRQRPRLESHGCVVFSKKGDLPRND